MIFEYLVKDDVKVWEGSCVGVSEVQAIDRARVDYIYRRWGIRPKDREFKSYKEDADQLQTRVVLSLGSILYYQKLKVAIHHDPESLSDSELHDYAELQHYFKGK